MNEINDIIRETTPKKDEQKEKSTHNHKTPNDFKETKRLPLNSELREKVVRIDLTHEVKNTALVNEVYSKLVEIFFKEKRFWRWLTLLFVLFLIMHANCEENEWNEILEFFNVSKSANFLSFKVFKFVKFLSQNTFTFIIFVLGATLTIFPTVRTLRKIVESILKSPK